MNSTEEMRRAATEIRELAQVGSATNYPTPWGVEMLDPDTYGLASRVTCLDGEVTDALDDDVAQHIAAWDPEVALAVADWIESTADECDMNIAHYGAAAKGLAVARLILRRARWQRVAQNMAKVVVDAEGNSWLGDEWIDGPAVQP